MISRSQADQDRQLTMKRKRSCSDSIGSICRECVVRICCTTTSSRPRQIEPAESAHYDHRTARRVNTKLCAWNEWNEVADVVFYTERQELASQTPASCKVQSKVPYIYTATQHGEIWQASISKRLLQCTSIEFRSDANCRQHPELVWRQSTDVVRGRRPN